MTPTGAPTMFVIDDDDVMHAVHPGDAKSVGLGSDPLGTAGPMADPPGAPDQARRASQPCARMASDSEPCGRYF
jgi:hypothetical protein